MGLLVLISCILVVWVDDIIIWHRHWVVVLAVLVNKSLMCLIQSYFDRLQTM